MAEIIKTESRTVIEAIWATDWEGEEHEVLGEVVGNLRVVDLLSLKHGEQLNDQVINTYCRMLCTKNVNYIDTYILTATLEGNQELSMLERGDIEPYQLLIGCLHVNGNHWVAVGIDVVDHIFWYMDPLNFTYKPTRQMEEKVANWNNFVRSKGIQQEWELRVPSDSPLQSDSTSCGVYSLKFLENLVAHEENQNFNTNAVRLQIGVKFLEALSPKIGCHKCCWSDSSFMWRCGICQRQFHRYCKQCVGHVLEMCHLCVHAFMASDTDGTSTTPAEVQQPHSTPDKDKENNLSDDGSQEPPAKAKKSIRKRFVNILKKGKNKGKKWLKRLFCCSNHV